MSPILVTILVGVVAAAIGGFIGWRVGSRKSEDVATINELEAQLQAALDKRAEYENDVHAHFSKTAELLTQLTNDYKSVYQHIASGAQQLCDTRVDVPALLHADEPATPSHSIIPETPAQPLDYAPRSENTPGQLDETFGLKTASDDTEQTLSRP